MIPYEYKITLTPDRSMATGTNLDVHEYGYTTWTGSSSSGTFLLYSGTGSNQVNLGPIPPILTSSGTQDQGFYLHSGSRGAAITDISGGPPPTNPVFYAFDSPGFAISLVNAVFNARPDLNAIFIERSLTSYPAYIVGTTTGTSGASASRNFYYNFTLVKTGATVTGTTITGSSSSP